MIERSRIGAESLQILAEAAKRAGSEDGLEGITDSCPGASTCNSESWPW